MDCEAGFGLQLLEERLQVGVGDFDAVIARPANQVMMLVPGGLVNQLPVTNVRYQQQPLVGQEGQGAVDGRFGQFGEYPVGALVNFASAQVAVRLLDDAQNHGPLRGDAVALRLELSAEMMGHV